MQCIQILLHLNQVRPTCCEWAGLLACNVRNIQTVVHWLGQPAIIHWGPASTKTRRLPSYLPLRISCCLMFFMKWTFLKLFGRGEPDRVRHLKCGTQNFSTHKSKELAGGSICPFKQIKRVWVAFITCEEEHFPLCPLVFQAKNAER